MSKDAPRVATSFRAFRLLHFAVLICLEATLIHLLGVLVSSADPLFSWWVLVAVVAIATIVTARFEPVNTDASHIRRGTGVIALGVIVWATAAHQGIYNPLRVFDALSLLVALDDPRFLGVYLGLAASMWAWWRGTAVIDQGHTEVLRMLRRNTMILIGLLTLLGLIGFDPIFRSADRTPIAAVAIEMTGFMLLGFIALSLTRIVEAAAHSTHGAEWRWLRSSLASTSVILLIGLLLLAFLADPAGVVLRSIVQWVVYAMVFLMAPFIAGILALMQFLRQLIPDRPEGVPVSGTVTAVPDTVTPTELPGLPSALLAIPTIILLLIPIVALLLVILYARRRRSRTDLATGEERESIFSWGALGADLAGLLRGLRRPGGDEGLRGALRRLLAEDPATRIRRRYVQLLLKGEVAGRQRLPHQTPHEFAPALAETPDDDQAVNTLTGYYEQARYAPATVDATTAAAAERVWETLNRDEPPRRS